MASLKYLRRQAGWPKTDHYSNALLLPVIQKSSHNVRDYDIRLLVCSEYINMLNTLPDSTEGNSHSSDETIYRG